MRGPLRPADQSQEPGKQHGNDLEEKRDEESHLCASFCPLSHRNNYAAPPTTQVLLRTAHNYRLGVYFLKVSNSPQRLRWWSTLSALGGALSLCPCPGQGRHLHSQPEPGRCEQSSTGLCRWQGEGGLHTQGNNRDWIVYACGKGRMNMDKTLCAFC